MTSRSAESIEASAKPGNTPMENRGYPSPKAIPKACPYASSFVTRTSRIFSIFILRFKFM
ncbi:MAG: hypothetical protein IJO79_01620 [Firmicutes bacterium]|nr:hypothetical protein [Bacillota bacterium]